MKVVFINNPIQDENIKELSQGWTASEKNLPQIGGIYLCVVETKDELFGIEKNVHCCYFNHNTQTFYWDRMDANITHWISIPKIP